MSLVSITEMLKEAKKENYAVGQFNINNLEFIQAILQAAKEMNSPVILGVTEVAVDYMGGFKLIAKMVEELIDFYDVTVPVALHFDHGSSFEKCREAIQNGFTSVMIDGSSLSLKDNIELTKRVVDVAHPLGVSVEGELGHISGQEDGVIVAEADATYATVSEVEQFVNKTQIDCLAPAIGSVHGPFRGTGKLEFDLLFEIEEKVKIPLALHGGTHIPPTDIQKAISLGITKINVNTENQIALAMRVRELLLANPNMYDFREYLGPAREAIKNVVKGKIRIFGSCKEKNLI
jgi:fructose-bisphosphate aldolase class II